MTETWEATSSRSMSMSMSNIFGRGFLKVKGFSGTDKQNKITGLNDAVNLGDFSVNRNDDSETKESSGSNASSDKGKGSLLRLFQSDIFDSHLHMYYIYHHREHGVHEYLVNLLYEKSDGVLWYLPQLCEISMNKYDKSSLWKFFLDKSSENMNFSLVLSWFYQAIQEDNLPNVSFNAQNMQQEIEMAVVNSKLKPDIRYIEKRLGNWRKSRISLLANTPLIGKAYKDFESEFEGENLDNSEKYNNTGFPTDYCMDGDNSSSYFNKDNTKTQLSLTACSAMPSSETINGFIEEDSQSDFKDRNLNAQKMEAADTSSLSFPLSSCDVLPDIWIYRIVNGEEDCFFGYNYEDIKSKLDIINRQFKYLYSNTSFAAEYNPNGTSINNKDNLCGGIFNSSPFGNIIMSGNDSNNYNNCSSSANNCAKKGSKVDIVTGVSFGSGNNTVTGNSTNISYISNNSNNNGGLFQSSARVSIPYFFFNKLGSPFDLIDVNKLITEIHLKSRSRIEKSILSGSGCVNEDIFQVYISEIEKESETLYYLLKQHRCNYYNRINQLVAQLLEISNFLQANINKEHRDEILEFIMEELNLWLFYSRFSISLMDTTFLLNGLSLPMFLFSNSKRENGDNNDENCLLSGKSNESIHLLPYSFTSDKSLINLNNCHFLRIIPEECKVFNSRKRVHFLLAIEVADLDEEFTLSSTLVSKDIVNYLKNHGMSIKNNSNNDKSEFVSGDNVSENVCYIESENERLEARKILTKFLNILSIGISESLQDDDEEVYLGDKDIMLNSVNNLNNTDDIQKTKLEEINTGWPQETWNNKIERYRKDSPYSNLRSWDVKTLLLKSSDDLRQELLASQLLQQFDWIFKTSGLPLWLRPCEILVVGSHGGFIEYIHDTFSIDSLKRRFKTDNLNHCFQLLFDDEKLRNNARKCFAESHAAYSLVSYFLQVKDRHNGNFLIDKQGHIIQIDYGFMLSNSPGNVNFEQSPFKLTQEFLDVLLGEDSAEFKYFQELITKGFLASRKHVDQIVLTIETMSSATKLPCFAFLGNNKEYFIQEIRDRFFLHLTEEQCILKVSELIQSSINNWRSIQYDAFQRLTNGIL
ncbi:phosphatidylinositol 4-kinase [Cryptosporidium ryanae]|uniref:phosphatidylinositol 4-kinase n=1 Tax=Cryptosporidium ryanae TaxID=515981 RepID=UPI003519EF06|nr:phosphatidylinositol 4-kinase [Cryptosporidium ryanae]